MGGRSSKVVITPENAETAANPPGEVAQLKLNGDAPPAVDPVAEPNGEQHVGDTTAEAILADNSTVEAKKKSNPINWIQKKISFKKTKTPKKPAIEEEPNEIPKETEPVATKAKAKEEVTPTTADDVQVQSEVIPTADEGTTNPEAAEIEAAVERVVEVAPSTEEVRRSVGEEQFVEELEQRIEENGDVDPHEEPVEESQADFDLAEKMANLGIDTVRSVTNGVEVHLNGEGVVAADES